MELQCRVLRMLLLLCMGLQLVFFVLAWSSALPAGSFMQMSANGIGVAEVRALGSGQRAAGALLSLPGLLALAYGLWRLYALLARLERRTLFDLATIGHLRGFAAAVLASTLAGIVEPAVRGLVFRYGFGDAGAVVSMGLSSEVLLLVLVCGLFYLITDMMHEGRRLAEENEGFV